MRYFALFVACITTACAPVSQTSTLYPLAMLNAFRSLLREAGIPNPEAKIFPSNIPLRT